MNSSIRQALESDDVNLALLKVLADNSFDSILVTDATKAGKIIYANKAFKKLTGYSQDEVIGKTPRILQGTGTDRKVIKELSAALSSGRKFEGKAINFKKGGTPFIMHWRVLPVKVGRQIRAWVAIQRETSGL
ncbi:MAG: PAS domain S-box protein [Woeseiaceae bacterium]|jgi:PAS domain S-box-containing protein